MAPHLRDQLGVLFGDRQMPVRPTLVGDRRQRTCRTTFLPFRDLPQMWQKPRKVNVVPSAFGWSFPSAKAESS
jgi:hypothetical protein